MVPDLNDDNLWANIQAVITEMYLRQFNRINSSNNTVFRELKILFGIRLSIDSSGYYRVSYGDQLRTGHISELIGSNIPDPKFFSLPGVMDPTIYTPDKLTPKFNKYQDEVIPKFNENEANKWDKDPFYPFPPLSPFNSGQIVPPSELMKMSARQVEYYNIRMRDMLNYGDYTQNISKEEFNNLYLGSWREAEEALVEKITGRPSPKKEFDIREVPEDFKIEGSPIYEDRLIDDYIEGVEDMGTENNDQNTGWHSPIIRYDPNYVKPEVKIEAPPRFPRYAQDTLQSIYEQIGRIKWDPNKPSLIGPNSRVFNEISGETYIHPSWLEVARVPIQNKDYMTASFIPTLRRKLEYERIVLERKLLAERKYPTNDLFNEFIVEIHKGAIKRDENRDMTRKSMLAGVKKLLKNAGFIHMPIHEEMVGAATLAKNIILTLSEENRGQISDYQKVVKTYFDHVLNNKNDRSQSNLILVNSPPTFTVRGYIDFEPLTYPKYMGEEMTAYYSKIKNNPTDMVYQIMKHNVDMLSNIIKGMPGDAHLESNVYIINPIEWALDFIRYAIECLEYYAASKDLDQIFMRDLEADPIYEPLPIRMAVNIAIKFPYDLEFGALPAEIVDAYESNNNNKNLLNKELWDGTSFMTAVRDLPWRQQIAPQLWDTVFYCSTRTIKMNRKGDQIGPSYKNDPYDNNHTTSIYSIYDRLNRRIMAGKDAYTDNSRPLIGRKDATETHDELGWYLGFYNPSKMEGL